MPTVIHKKHIENKYPTLSFTKSTELWFALIYQVIHNLYIRIRKAVISKNKDYRMLNENFKKVLTFKPITAGHHQQLGTPAPMGRNPEKFKHDQ